MWVKQTTVASIGFLAAIGLAGCGGGGESGAGASGAEDAAEVRVEVTGDVESTLSTNGSIYCGAGEGSDPEYMFEVYVISSSESLNLRLNRALAAGTHPIVGSGDPARNTGADAYFYYRGPNRTQFDQVSAGSITIENIPTASGESLIASINADLSDGDDQSIRLRADLNVAAGRQTFDECP